MPLIPFPNVPNSSGVPAVPRSSTSTSAKTVSLGLAQSLIWRIFQVQTKWGIHDSKGKALGDPAIFTGLAGDALETTGIGSTLSTNSVDYQKQNRVSDYPIERGGFVSYNKVQIPANPTVVMCLDASESDRSHFIKAVETACDSTNLYSVVTPEITYTNYTLESMSYSRRAYRGATLIIMEIKLQEVRSVSVSYTSAISNPKDPGASSQSDSGVVQSQTPATSVLKSIANKISGLTSDALAAIQN